ncbi:MAG: cytochrome b/b6 domain-containing protein [Planctomycetaceae bacterium]|nr:cytochrome b/b6 domain-containing protein [Planctomycetaceae bacterium]
MSGPIEPQWNLLPDDPEAFFGLTGEYDLRDLKRKYNSYIRQFKPERFPEEFQRIRAAFERLNDALRYQERPRSSTALPDLQFDWNFSESLKQNSQPDSLPPEPVEPRELPWPDHSRPVERSDGLSAQSEPQRLYERISVESLPGIFEDLKQKEEKTPYDYYTLAVLSDVRQDETHAFAYWLLKGLQAHPDEPALFELLRQYFASQPSSDGLPELLEATSRAIRTDRFYYLTERAWDELLRHDSFSDFREHLETCETNLLDHRVDHMLVFYLHILKTAVWKASDHWLREKFGEIEAHYDRLPYWAEEEIDFLEQINQYRSQRSQFLEGGPVRAMIDQAIFDYCTQRESDADRSFLECQNQLVSLEDEVLREFDVPEKDFGIALYLWERISSDVLERIADDPYLVSNDSLEVQSKKLGHRLMTEGRGTRYRFFHYVFAVLGIGLMGTIGLMIYYLIYIFDSFWINLLKIFGIIVGDFILLLLVGALQDRVLRGYYRSWWRFELMRFYQTKWFPLEELADELEQIKSIKVGDEEREGLDKIAEAMRKDVGLFLYVNAQRLLTACQ